MINNNKVDNNIQVNDSNEVVSSSIICIELFGWNNIRDAQYFLSIL